MYEINDLTPIFSLGDSIVLFVLSDDPNKSDPRCFQINFETKTFDIGNLQNFLKFNPFTRLDDNELIIFKYSSWINRKLKDETILELLNEINNG
ncbi:MAG: hypothetical protein Q8T08_16770 [Ignavibacteria bacterium]|nr:hypothetical protein [Ignavibacteria bacterium]